MHILVNLPKHKDTSNELRVTIDKGALTFELRSFEVSDRPTPIYPNGLGTGATSYLGAFIGELSEEKRAQLINVIGHDMIFLISKAQEAGYEQAKSELRQWLAGGK